MLTSGKRNGQLIESMWGPGPGAERAPKFGHRPGRCTTRWTISGVSAERRRTLFPAQVDPHSTRADSNRLETKIHPVSPSADRTAKVHAIESGEKAW